MNSTSVGARLCCGAFALAGCAAAVGAGAVAVQFGRIGVTWALPTAARLVAHWMPGAVMSAKGFKIAMGVNFIGSALIKDKFKDKPVRVAVEQGLFFAGGIALANHFGHPINLLGIVGGCVSGLTVGVSLLPAIVTGALAANIGFLALRLLQAAVTGPKRYTVVE